MGAPKLENEYETVDSTKPLGEQIETFKSNLIRFVKRHPIVTALILLFLLGAGLGTVMDISRQFRAHNAGTPW